VARSVTSERPHLCFGAPSRKVALHSQIEKFPRLWANRCSRASGWGMAPHNEQRGPCLRMLRDSLYFLTSLPWVVVVLGWLLSVPLAP